MVSGVLRSNCNGGESRVVSWIVQNLFKIAKGLISKKQTKTPRNPNVFGET